MPTTSTVNAWSIRSPPRRSAGLSHPAQPAPGRAARGPSARVREPCASTLPPHDRHGAGRAFRRGPGYAWRHARWTHRRRRRPRPRPRSRAAAVALTATLSLLIGVGTRVRVRCVQAGRRRADDPSADGIDSSGGGAGADGPCVDDVCNYLLLGSDSRAGLTAEERDQFGTDQQIGGENRADTIMLVHTDPALEKAIILSFPRDLSVRIPGHGEDKINAAFEGGIDGGGPALVARDRAQAHRPQDQPRPLRGPGRLPGRDRHARRRGHVHPRREREHARRPDRRRAHGARREAGVPDPARRSGPRVRTDHGTCAATPPRPTSTGSLGSSSSCER